MHSLDRTPYARIKFERGRHEQSDQVSALGNLASKFLHSHVAISGAIIVSGVADVTEMARDAVRNAFAGENPMHTADLRRSGKPLIDRYTEFANKYPPRLSKRVERERYYD